MKKLILVRHAKSSWDSPLLDKERPLANRGMNDAHLVSSQIAKFLPAKFVVFSSTARRAVQTAMIFAQNMSYPEDSIQFKDDLYTFEVDDLAAEIKKIDNDYSGVVIVGHNDALFDFINKFGDRKIKNFPTSGFAALDFDVDSWEQIKKGKLLKIIVPKDFK